MEELARKYARKILLGHLVLLAIVILIVIFAAREVYKQAKDQAKTQFLEKQSLLAQQTSNAIEAHYQAILSSLDIVEKQDQTPRAAFPLLSGGSQNNLLANAALLLEHQLMGSNGDERIETLFLIGLVGAPGPGDPQPPGGMQPLIPGGMQPGGAPGMGGMGAPPPTSRPVSAPASLPSFEPSRVGAGRGEIGGRAGGVGARGGIGGRGGIRGGGRGWTPPAPDQIIFLGFYPEGRLSHEREYRDMVSQYIRTIETPTINSSREFLKGIGNLIIYPSKLRRFWWTTRTNNAVFIQEVWLAAVVPIQNIKTKFLDDLTREFPGSDKRSKDLIALLADDEGKIVAASNSEYSRKNYKFGDDLSSELDNPVISRAIEDSRRLVAEGQMGELKFVTSSDELGTLEPVVICDKTWYLLILTPSSKIDGMVASVFKKAMWWSILLVLGMTAILVSSSTTMIRSRLRLETLRNEVMSRELQQARKIQMAWLPRGRGNLPIDVAAINQPANHVSGDFYDWFMLPDGRVVATIGDVTGHGMSAAFLMATSQLLIRNTMVRLLDPGECLTEVNRQLCGQVFFGQFVSACILVIDPARNTLQAASAGHFDPILYTDAGAGKIEVDSQLVLGIEQGERYPTTRITLPDKYFILLYTDGIIDARSTSGEPYGSARLRNDYVPLGSADLTIQTLLKNVADFQKGADPVDDITLVAIQSPCPNSKEQI